MKVRGFVYFEDRSFEEVINKKNIFEKAFPNCKKGYFSSLFWDFCDKKEIFSPGIFISGETNKGSSQVVSKLRKIMRLSNNLLNCDISTIAKDKNYFALLLGSEGKELKGFYLGIRLKNSYALNSVQDFALSIEKSFSAEDVFIRGVEKDQKSGIPNLCVDVLVKKSVYWEKAKKEIKNLMRKNELEDKGFTFIRFRN